MSLRWIDHERLSKTMKVVLLRISSRQRAYSGRTSIFDPASRAACSRSLRQSWRWESPATSAFFKHFGQMTQLFSSSFAIQPSAQFLSSEPRRVVFSPQLLQTHSTGSPQRKYIGIKTPPSFQIKDSNSY